MRLTLDCAVTAMQPFVSIACVTCAVFQPLHISHNQPPALYTSHVVCVSPSAHHDRHCRSSFNEERH